MNSKIGNYNKQQLQDQLESMGLKGDETILIHSSMKSIGEVDGGADTVLDAWMEYFKDGLLLLPTHTWKTVNADNPVYNPQTTPSCVGLLTNMFMKRDGVIRSLHPTHSMAGYGKNAAEYLAGEEYNNTPCTPGGCYDRLKDAGGKVLLVGVGHERNTYIHSVEEVLNVPNRLSDMPMERLSCTQFLSTACLHPSGLEMFLTSDALFHHHLSLCKSQKMFFHAV